MKRITILFAALLAILTLSGCAAKQPADTTLQFYYKTAEVTFQENGLVGCESADFSGTVEQLATRYFLGPKNEALVSPFPKGTALVSYSVVNERLVLQLSEAFAGLSGVDLTLALSCISLTFSQMEDISSVEVSVQGQLLGGQQSVVLRDDEILLADDSVLLADTTLSIYYADENNRYLIPQEVKTKLETVEEQAAYAVSLLGQTPDNDTLHSTLPTGTEILDLSIENGQCTLDLSSDFLRNRPETDDGERMTILALVNTLTDFADIDRVQFYVEGQQLATYYHMDLSLVYVREEQVVGPVRPGLNELDASLYVLRQRDRVLTEIPIRLKPAANETAADTILRELVNYGNSNGFATPIPSGTKVLSVAEKGNACAVDLSASFADALQTEETQLLAIDAIVSSLKSIEGVRFVTITIEGESTGLDYVDLTQAF